MRWGALVVVGLGCSPGALGPSYRGPPLFTVEGQLETNGPAPTGPLRLAVAWYPDEAGNTAPRAIVTQDVEYQGSFPLNYTFSFFAPPPEGALATTTYQGVTARSAFGVLLAYEDTNGNGRLDSIPSGASAIDRVLGTSIGDSYNGLPAARPVWVAYVEGQPGGPWASFAPGYNLYQTDAVQPAGTRVALRLDGTSELQYFVCEELISGANLDYDLPCNVAPTGGARVVGTLARFDGRPTATLRVTDGARALPSAQVFVNGARVPFDAATGFFLGVGVPLVTPGTNEVTVMTAGAPLVLKVEAPGPFEIATSAELPRVLQSGSSTITWPRARGAVFYQVAAGPARRPGGALQPFLVRDEGGALTAALSGFTRPELHAVSVSGFARGYLAYGRGGSLVSVSVGASAYVDVLPDDVGLWLEGSLVLTHFDGQTYGAAWLSAFDGVTPFSAALVTVDGEPLTFDGQVQLYKGAVQLAPEQTATLGISAPGRPRQTYRVELPGEFTPTRPPRTHPRGTPLPVSWTRAARATDYRVLVNDAAGNQLHFQNVLETEAVIPGLEPGRVTLTIGAARYDDAGHLVGLIHHAFELDVQP